MRSSYKASNKRLLPILSRAPQGSILAFPPTQDRSQLTPVSSPVGWAGTGSHDSTFQHAWASRQCAVAWIWVCTREAAHPGPFVPRFEAVLWLSAVYSNAHPFSGWVRHCCRTEVFKTQAVGFWWVGHGWTPGAPPTMFLPSSSGQGRENIMKSSQAKVRPGRDNQLPTQAKQT